MTRGIYRTQNEESGARYVLVDYGVSIMELLEQRYRERGYKPEFNKLPWKNEYGAVDAAKKAKEGGNA